MEETATAPPSIPASTSVETRSSGGDRFQLRVSAVGSMPGSGCQGLSFQGLHPRLQDCSRSPRTTISAALPGPSHRMPAASQGWIGERSFKMKTSSNARACACPRARVNTRALTAASLSVLQFVIPACWQAQSPGGQWIWPRLSCIYTLLFTRKPITLSEPCKNPLCCQ